MSVSRRRLTSGALLASVALTASLLAPLPAAGAPTHNEPAFVEQKVRKATGRTSGLVHVRKEARAADAIAAARAAGLETGTLYEAIKVFVAYGEAASFTRLARSPAVEWIESNRRARLFTNTSHKATRGQNVLDGDVTLPDGTAVDGSGVGVAVVDSGIDGTHPDLSSRMGGNVKIVCTTPQFVAFAPTGGFTECVGPKTAVPLADTDHPSAGGHGTHVAGTVAGTGTASSGLYHGAAPGATLYGVSVGTTIAVENGLDGLAWVLENHDQVTPAIKVVNNSWGSSPAKYDPENGVFHKATWKLQEALIAEGVTVVFAAGNSAGNGNSATTSAECTNPTPGLICVANYDDGGTGTRAGSINSSSSRGKADQPESWPDLSAPGTSITATCRWTLPVCYGSLGFVSNPPNTYAVMSGTSMAAPHVAGIVAQVVQADPTLTPAGIENLLEDTAHKFSWGSGYGTHTDPTNPDNSSSFEKGHGLVDALAAVQAILGGGQPDPDPTETATPDPEPTETTPPPPATTTTYYFHSGTGANTTDKPTGTATFDEELPTFTEPALATDVPGAGNVNPTQLWDPTWTGDVIGTIRELKVDFWAKVPEEEAQTGGVTWRVSVWKEGVETVLPSAAIEGFNPTDATRFTHTFSTMLTNPTDQTSTVPLSLDASGPVSLQIRPNFINGAGGTILYDAVDFPSGFSVTTGASPSPTPTETASPTPTETASPTPTDDPTEPPPPTADCGAYPEIPNDPYFGGEAPVVFEPQQWGPRVIQAPAAWQEPGGTGCGVKVAVLDSGLDIAAPNNGGVHPDFRCDDKVEIAPGAAATGEGTADDIDGHGTHVAGIIGACTNNGVGTMGVAPDATIMPFRVFSDDANYDGDGNDNGSDDLADAIRNAADAGAHVINMSLSFGIAPVPGTGLLGSQYEYTNIATVPPEIRAAMQYAQEAGVVIVAAAGNDTTLPICDYPAIAKDVICVGATDPRDVRTWYSNGPNKPQTDGSFGPSVVAPGGTETVAFCDVYQENVFSTYSREHDAAPCSIDTGYQTVNGTSMASPHAAAVAALAYGRLSGERSAENARTVIDAVLQGAKDLGAPGYDPVFGYGRVDALATVLAVPFVEPTGPTATALSFTETSAAGAQHTDEAEIAAQLSNAETGAPVADAEIVFELTGPTGTRSFTATTDADGVAAHSFKVVEQPDQYVLTARFSGDEELYVGSADTGSFVVDREGSHSTLSVEGKGNDRTATATLTDADDEAFGLEGKTIEFFADDRSVGTATTNADGVAVLEIPARDARGSREFTAVFEGDGYFNGSTGTSRI